jgi:biotin carboxyl carrier protein
VSDLARAPRLEWLGDGRVAVRHDDVVELVYAATTTTGTWIWYRGYAHFIPVDADEGTARVSRDDAALTAPMPATVRSISVGPGQRVAAGDVLVVLEAMKMELVIKAPADGQVRAVRCTVGELVQPGIPLVEMT